MIVNRVKGAKLMLIGELSLFQGELKQLSKEAKNKLKESIRRNGFSAPIFIWEGKNYILDGTQRITVVKEMLADGEQFETGDKLPVVEITAEDKKQAAELVLAYNSQYGEITKESLLEFAKTYDLDLSELGLSIELSQLNIDKIAFDENRDKDATGSLRRDYIIPPFSILDSRNVDWQERKKAWVEQIPSPEKTREGVLGRSIIVEITKDTSLFDPVLAEILFSWFCPPKGLILNLYAGGIEPNFVAGSKGFKLKGIELRKEQVDYTNKILTENNIQGVELICDDVQNMDTHIENNSVDLLFSCPPYYDLEKYDDEPKDLANMSDEDFEKVYAKSISDGVKKLKDNRFAAFVVSEVRDKNGFYRKLPTKTIKYFEEAGAKYYNEIILINAIGSLPLRVRKFWESSRKIGRMHQNILIFVKGDPKIALSEMGKGGIDDPNK